MSKSPSIHLTELRIHYLQYGHALCNIPGSTREWPKKHKWTECWDKVNCPDCILVKPARVKYSVPVTHASTRKF